MSIVLTENPVQTISGVVNNLFAGFEPVEFKFKREDEQIAGVGAGTDNKLLINTLSDLSTYLNVGDFVYVYSEGLTYTYDLSAAIIEITANTITIDSDFIEGTSSGYINYYKNYYLEAQLVNVDNSDIQVLPFSLQDDGDNAGNITIDVSLANDKNIQFFEFVTQELTASRILFKVQYREVWDISDNGFTLINDEIILAYATQQMEVETFVNDLDEPKIWKGYPFGVILAHSSQNSDDEGLEFVYDELDINQTVLTSDNALASIDSDDEGLIFINIDKDTVYDADAEYITLKASYTTLPDFEPTDFSADFKIT